MPADNKNILLFWIYLIFLLSALVIVQSSILPLFIKPFFIPYLLYLPLFHFLLYKGFFESLSLLILVSLLSSVFLSHHLSLMFFIHLSGFLIFLMLKEIFLFQSILALFTFVFFFSFYFSFLIEKSLFFSDNSLSGLSISSFLSQTSSNFLTGSQIFYYSSKSFSTSLFFLLQRSFYKKYLSKDN